MSAVCAFGWATPALSEPQIIVDPVAVTVTASQSERQLLRVPSLDFTFTVVAECPTATTPHAVYVSVADGISYQRDRTADLFEIELTVPANQVPPIRVNDFCAATDSEERIHYADGALTAQLGIMCESEPDQNGHVLITTTPFSQDLDIEFVCEPQDETGEISDDD